MKEIHTIYFKCNDCGEKGFYYHVSSGHSCGFCFKTLDIGRSEWKKGPNYYKRVAKEHDYDEKTNQYTKFNHECKGKCINCEEAKDIKDCLWLAEMRQCDKCSWSQMTDEIKQENTL